MREILFRGKKTTNGEWVIGNYSRNVCDAKFDTIEDCENFPHLICGIDPDTVGQYTGLNDKNGKRIFEGDVIKARIEAGNHKSYEWPIMPVSFNNGSFCMIDRKGSVFANMSAFAPHISFEVIGNVHDHPELIAEVEG